VQHSHKTRLIPATLAGALIAWWLAWYVLPGVVIYTDEHDKWERVDLDWDSTLLKRRFGH
jgi:hypothetical protein